MRLRRLSDGAIECWMRESRFERSSDFWRASPDGKLFLLRAYQEDFAGLGVTAFDFFTPKPQLVQREIAELRKSRV